MDNQVFTGVGKNPHGRDLPLGFGFRLQESPSALQKYTSLTERERDMVLDYVQGGSSGIDAETRVAHAVDCLSNGQMP